MDFILTKERKNATVAHLSKFEFFFFQHVSQKMERFTFVFTVLAVVKHYLVWGARRQFSNNKPFTELLSKASRGR